MVVRDNNPLDATLGRRLLLPLSSSDGQRLRDLLALDPDVGNGDALPEGGAGQRADGLDAPRSCAVGADDRIVFRHIEPDADRIGPQRPARQQSAQ